MKGQASKQASKHAGRQAGKQGTVSQPASQPASKVGMEDSQPGSKHASTQGSNQQPASKQREGGWGEIARHEWSCLRTNLFVIDKGVRALGGGSAIFDLSSHPPAPVGYIGEEPKSPHPAEG